MLRHEQEIEPAISLFETYIDFVRGGNYETCAIIVFALMLLLGVWEMTMSERGLSDEVAKDLFAVGALSIMSGLIWPVLVPLVCVAAIVVALYKIMRKLRCRKLNSK